ncbi:MAG: carbonic anhydrase [Deltaproteobacteria bacterium]|nr:carbonic anhydrase [Deltaproteobacteria bacterium]
MVEKNVKTDFSPKVFTPKIDKTSFVHKLASVIGNVILGKNIMVAPTACVRGDEGQPICVDDDANIQDGVVIHALETFSHGKEVEKNICVVDGSKYAVYVGKRVSLAHQAQIHGPAVVLEDSFIGMKVLVFKARVGRGCVVEPGAIVLGVSVPDGRYVPTGMVLKSQKDADALPQITEEYPFKDLNKGVVHVNTSLAKAYLAAGKKKVSKK